jgi:hypothetical protein
MSSSQSLLQKIFFLLYIYHIFTENEYNIELCAEHNKKEKKRPICQTTIHSNPADQKARDELQKKFDLEIDMIVQQGV